MMFFEIVSGIAIISSFMVLLLWTRIFISNIKNAQKPYYACSLCLVSTGLLFTSSIVFGFALCVILGCFFVIDRHIAVAIVLCWMIVANLFFIWAASINYSYLQIKVFLASSFCWIIFNLLPLS